MLIEFENYQNLKNFIKNIIYHQFHFLYSHTNKYTVILNLYYFLIILKKNFQIKIRSLNLLNFILTILIFNVHLYLDHNLFILLLLNLFVEIPL